MMNGKELDASIHFSNEKDYIEGLWKEEWITLYKSLRKEGKDYTNDINFHTIMVSAEKRQKYNRNFHWIFSTNLERPGIIEYNVPDKWIDKLKARLFKKSGTRFNISLFFKKPVQLKMREKIKKLVLSYKTRKIREYQRFGEIGVEPLVYVRTFNNRPAYIEISEEFRHYFNLYEDRKQDVFFSFDSSGNPIEVIKIINKGEKDEEVKIKRKYLNEFLYVKKMWLCVQFNYNRTVYQSLDSITEQFKSIDSNYIYCIKSIRSHDKLRINLCGKRFIKYDEVKYLWYEKEKKYEEFSFIDHNGEEKSFTCEEDEIAPVFHDKETGIPGYMTLISFKKDVLKKYYDKSSQYSVKGNYLDCQGLWGMPMDIQDDRIVVYLGDLSKIPYEEQKYWRSYNIIEKAGISQEAWERDIEGKWNVETDQLDFFFKETYKQFNQNWYEKYGWCFFKPLSDDDKHCFNSLRSPLNEEQSEFDTQVLNLVKVFIESINVKKIKETFPASYEKGSKTIDTLEEWLISKNIRSNDMLEFLRKLQKLRSKGAAHIKDRDYKNIIDYFKSFKEIKNPESKKEIFFVILTRCIQTINTLNKLFLSEGKDSLVENKIVSNQSNLMEI